MDPCWQIGKKANLVNCQDSHTLLQTLCIILTPSSSQFLGLYIICSLLFNILGWVTFLFVQFFVIFFPSLKYVLVFPRNSSIFVLDSKCLSFKLPCKFLTFLCLIRVLVSCIVFCRRFLEFCVVNHFYSISFRSSIVSIVFCVIQCLLDRFALLLLCWTDSIISLMRFLTFFPFLVWVLYIYAFGSFLLYFLLEDLFSSTWVNFAV